MLWVVVIVVVVHSLLSFLLLICVLYRQKKGKYTRLVGRHANYPIGTKGAVRWLEHMAAAIEEHTALQNDNEAKTKLLRYFQYTAHYIVAAKSYMRPDQVRLPSMCVCVCVCRA